MKIDQLMAIYQAAIDETASLADDMQWWLLVQPEIEAVIAAPTNSAAAEIIAWWKSAYEWTQCSDTAACAASRIRRAAKTMLK